MLKELFKSLKQSIWQQDFVRYKGLTLPVSRNNEKLSDNRAYLNSGVEQLNFLNRNNLINEKSKILDFGCGQGRLLNTLKFTNTAFSYYVGLDTSRKSINWCKKHLTYSTSISFIHLPANNARYNPEEKKLKLLPYENGVFDLIFVNSVFSHMLTGDINFYLQEFSRILKHEGKVYLTAFVEEDVPEVEENPSGYVSNSSGPLHRVRYEKNFFFKLVQNAGLKVQKYHNKLIERTKQSVFVLQKQ